MPRVKQGPKEIATANAVDTFVIKALEFYRDHPDGAAGEAKNRKITDKVQAQTVNARERGKSNAVAAGYRKRIIVRKANTFKGQTLQDAFADDITEAELEEAASVPE